MAPMCTVHPAWVRLSIKMFVFSCSVITVRHYASAAYAAPAFLAQTVCLLCTASTARQVYNESPRQFRTLTACDPLPSANVNL